jgi:hypothetical protein
VKSTVTEIRDAILPELNKDISVQKEMSTYFGDNMKIFGARPEIVVLLDVVENCPWVQWLHKIVHVIRRLICGLFMVEGAGRLAVVTTAKPGVHGIDKANKVDLVDGEFRQV